MRNLGLTVLVLQHNTLGGIYESMLKLGNKTGMRLIAQRRIDVIRRQLDEIRRLSGIFSKRKVMFVVGRTPATVSDLVVVGQNSFLNELISIAGGVNCFEDAQTSYPRIPREQMYARGPEVIIDMGDMGENQKNNKQHQQSVVEA